MPTEPVVRPAKPRKLLVFHNPRNYRHTAEVLSRRAVVEMGEKTGADNDYAVSWIKPHGKGRVFYTSLGHAHETIHAPRFLKHILPAIQCLRGFDAMTIEMTSCLGTQAYRLIHFVFFSVFCGQYNYIL